MEYIIRKATPADKQKILVMGRNIVDKYERTHLGDTMVDGYINSGACDNDFLKNFDNTTVLELNNEIIGLIIWIDNVIQGFLIDFPYWGTGAAQHLINTTINSKFKEFNEVTLECFETSPRANAFYKKMGFKKDGLIKDDMANRIIYKKIKELN